MRLFLKILIIATGSISILAALPIGFIAELSISGCCGAPSSGLEGLGYAIGGLVGVIGIVGIVFGIKFKQNSVK